MTNHAIWSRRAVLQGLGVGLVAIPIGAACSDAAISTANDATANLNDAAAPGHDDAAAGHNDDAAAHSDAAAANDDAGSDDAAAANDDAASNQPDAAVATTWATAGTAAITGNYRDPFAGGLGAACALYPASTLGPCHAMTVDRQDVSEGELGLPVRLVLAVVNRTCQPVPNASVEIWHTSPTGLYSGSDATNMCTSGDATARAKRYFRGIRTSGADGKVTFDTLFPGWYRGRTIHIHFTVRVGNTEFLTSQIYFDDALNNEIIRTQPIYSARGPKDTTNANDGVLRQQPIPDGLVNTERQTDGVMLAWKALSVTA